MLIAEYSKFSLIKENNRETFTYKIFKLNVDEVGGSRLADAPEVRCDWSEGNNNLATLDLEVLRLYRRSSDYKML